MRFGLCNLASVRRIIGHPQNFYAPGASYTFIKDFRIMTVKKIVVQIVIKEAP